MSKLKVIITSTCNLSELQEASQTALVQLSPQTCFLSFPTA